MFRAGILQGLFVYSQYVNFSSFNGEIGQVASFSFSTRIICFLIIYIKSMKKMAEIKMADFKEIIELYLGNLIITLYTYITLI